MPARRRFHLTPVGEQRFNQWLHTPSRCSVRAIRVEFITRLYFARAISPELALNLINVQIAETSAGLERLKTVLDEIPFEDTFNHIGMDLRVRQLALIFDWLINCRETIFSF